jgi:alanyl aminopeptidase
VAAPGPGAGLLTVRDQIALADSVRASFESGRLPFASALELLAPLANSPERFVASAPIELLASARNYYLEPAQLPAFQAYGRELYAAQLARLGWSGPADEDGEVRLLRAAVLSFLALVAEDPEVRREARARGEAYIAGGVVHPEAVGADYAVTALSVAAQEGGAASFDNLLAALDATEDSEVRGNLLAGLAAIDDDALRPRVLELALDKRLRLNEASRPLSGQISARGGNALAWQWLTEHYDAVRERLGAENAGFLPLAAAAFCSAERAAEIRAFFEPRMAATDGGPRNLASAIETVELCSALSTAQAAGAREFFAARAR